MIFGERLKAHRQSINSCHFPRLSLHPNTPHLFSCLPPRSSCSYAVVAHQSPPFLAAASHPAFHRHKQAESEQGHRRSHHHGRLAALRLPPGADRARLRRRPRQPEAAVPLAGVRQGAAAAAAAGVHGVAVRGRDVPALLVQEPQRVLRQEAEPVRAHLQDPHPGVPLRDGVQPGGGALRARHAGAPLQAHVPGEQGAHAGATGHLLPAGRLPRPPPPPRLPGLLPRGHPRLRAGHRGHRAALAPLLGRAPRQHLPRDEAVRAECGIAVHLRRGGDALHRGAEAVLPDAGERVQLDAGEPAGHPVPQGHEGTQAPGRHRGPHHRDPAAAAAREQCTRPPGVVPGRPRGADGRPDRRQRDRRHLRGPRHHRQRAHLDGQVPGRPPRGAQGRHRGAAGDRALQLQGGGGGGGAPAPDVGGHEADARDEPCDPGDDAGGVHPVLHLQGGRGGRGVPRVPDPQGLEGDAPVPEHPPQPRPLPMPGEVRPLPIRGCSQAQHVHAVRQRDPFVPRQRARQAGDAGAVPPPRHQVQVVHLQVRERRAVRPLRAAAQRPAHDLPSQGLMKDQKMWIGSEPRRQPNPQKPTTNKRMDGWKAKTASGIGASAACVAAVAIGRRRAPGRGIRQAWDDRSTTER